MFVPAINLIGFRLCRTRTADNRVHVANEYWSTACRTITLSPRCPCDAVCRAHTSCARYCCAYREYTRCTRRRDRVVLRTSVGTRFTASENIAAPRPVFGEKTWLKRHDRAREEQQRGRARTVSPGCCIRAHKTSV